MVPNDPTVSLGSIDKQFVDVLSRHQSGSYGIAGIKYGKDDREIVLQINNSTYSQINGLYSYWQTLK